MQYIINNSKRILLWYFIFLLYFVIALSSTSDRVLFLEEGIGFPLLSQKIPFCVFYFLFPFIFLINHFFALLTVSVYRNQTDVFENMDIRTVRILKFLFRFSLAFFPFFIFFILQIQISKFQDSILSTYHFLLLCLDFLLLLKYFPEKRSYYKIWTIPILFFAIYNFYLLFSILGRDSSEDVREYTINKALSALNPLFRMESGPVSFLFPRIDVSNQILLGRNRTYRFRNFNYADFKGSILELSAFNKARVQFAEFQEVQWRNTEREENSFDKK